MLLIPLQKMKQHRKGQQISQVCPNSSSVKLLADLTLASEYSLFQIVPVLLQISAEKWNSNGFFSCGG